MTFSARREVTAQVTVRAASGKRLGPSTRITSANIREYLPTREALAAAQRGFQEAGFQVAAAVGNNFAITAPAVKFEKMFGSRVRLRPGGTVVSIQRDGAASLELPLQTLPAPLAELLESVTFAEAMDLH